MIIISLNKDENSPITEEGEDFLANYGKNENGGIDYHSYFDIKACMQKYIDNINLNNTKYYIYDRGTNTSTAIGESEIKQQIYNLLSDKYISANNITLNNLYDYVKTIKKTATYLPVEATLIQDGDIKSFLVYGLVLSNEDYSLINKEFSIVNINIRTLEFSIEPIYGDYTSISEIKVGKLEEKIISNEDNKTTQSYIKAEDLPIEYIKIFKGLALGEPERLYNLLDEEYRNARFEDIDDFKNYINKNKSTIRSASLDKYKIDVYDDYSRYICIDKKENYYVINEKESLQHYTMMLDTYTIDLPEFILKYQNSGDNLKVALNIEKLVEATKMGDYKYIYNKLDESFKTNNFKTVSAFEKFMQGKFDATEDTIKYDKYEKVTGVHVYNIVVTDTSENKTINAKVVMDLKENRDFVFSFSVEN